MLIKVCNILSFEKLELNLDTPQLTSVCGPNGSGKTSFMELLSIIIYGRYSKKVSNSSLIRYGATEAKGEIEIDWGGLQVHIIRSYGSREKLDLLINGENVSGSSINATQDKIDALFGDYGFFRATTLYSQEDFEPFISSTDSEKKGVLETILQYGAFTEARAKADAKIKELFAEINEVNSEIKKNNGIAGSLREEIDDLWARLDKEKERIKKSVKDTDEEIQSLQFKRINTTVTEGLIRTRRGFLEDNEKAETQLMPEYNRLTYKIQKYDNLSTDIAILNSKINELVSQSIDKSCPTCKRPWDKSVIDRFFKDRDEKVAKLEKSMASLMEKKEVRDSILAEYGKVSTRLDELRADTAKVTKELADLERKKGEMDEHNNKINLQIEVLRSNNTNNDVSHLKKSIAFVESKLQATMKELKVLGESFDDLSRQVKLYEFWYIGFGNGGIKSLLLDKYCSIISDNINYYLGLLTDGAITTSFLATSKTKKGDIRDKINLDVAIDDKHIDYRELSGGQKTLVNLAIMLSLRRLASTRRRLVPVMLFDEVFASLDSDYSMKVAGVLNDVSKEVSVFIVSHHPVLKDYTGSSISLSYEDKKTRITMPE